MARWICSDDPIPEGHIRLSQAFDLYYEAVTPNWQGLDAAINEPMASPPAAGKVLSRFVLELGDAISGISRVPSQAARSIG